jgi:hypothetical protein
MRGLGAGTTTVSLGATQRMLLARQQCRPAQAGGLGGARYLPLIVEIAGGSRGAAQRLVGAVGAGLGGLAAALGPQRDLLAGAVAGAAGAALAVPLVETLARGACNVCGWCTISRRASRPPMPTDQSVRMHPACRPHTRRAGLAGEEAVDAAVLRAVAALSAALVPQVEGAVRVRAGPAAGAGQALEVLRIGMDRHSMSAVPGTGRGGGGGGRRSPVWFRHVESPTRLGGADSPR